MNSSFYVKTPLCVAYLFTGSVIRLDTLHCQFVRMLAVRIRRSYKQNINKFYYGGEISYLLSLEAGQIKFEI